MKNLSPSIPAQAPVHFNGIATPLYDLVKKLQISLLPQATNKNSFIVNDINKSVTVSAEENSLAYIIGNLLSNAIYRTSVAASVLKPNVSPASTRYASVTMAHLRIAVICTAWFIL